MKKNFHINLIILIHLSILSLTLHLFSFGSDFITGGIDGLCLVLSKFFHINATQGYFYNYVLYVILNFLALCLCLQQEKFIIFLKTSFIVCILLLQLRFLAFLEDKNFFPLQKIVNNFLIKCFLSIFLKNYLFFNDNNIKFFYATFLGSIGFGFSLGYIRFYGYTTGGMDIYQKFLTTKLHFSFTKSLFLTDGIIILLAFSYDFYYDRKEFFNFYLNVFNRLLLPYISLLIIGFLMQKIVKIKKI